MLDIGWTEFFVIGVLALIVVGPKDLPSALRAVTKAIRKARGLAREFQSGVDEMMREAELDDIRREMNSVRNFDPGDEFKKQVDPSGTLTDDFDPQQFNRELLERVEGRGAKPQYEAPEAATPPADASEAPAATTPPPEPAEHPAPAETASSEPTRGKGNA